MSTLVVSKLRIHFTGGIQKAQQLLCFLYAAGEMYSLLLLCITKDGIVPALVWLAG